MPIMKRWYGPRFSRTTGGYKHGTCGCCGCGAIVPPQNKRVPYAPFTEGVQLKLVVDGIPDTLGATVVGPVPNSGWSDQSWYEYSWSGMSQINGTYFLPVPVSQFGCIMAAYDETWGGAISLLDLEVLQVTKVFTQNCAGGSPEGGEPVSETLTYRVQWTVNASHGNFRSAVFIVNNHFPEPLSFALPGSAVGGGSLGPVPTSAFGSIHGGTMGGKVTLPLRLRFDFNMVPWDHEEEHQCADVVTDAGDNMAEGTLEMELVVP